MIECVFAASVIGLFIGSVKNRSKTLKLLVLLVPYVTFLFGLYYQATAAYMVSGKAGSMGYYLYALVPIESILLLNGLAALFPLRHHLKPVGIITGTMLGIEAFGTWLLLLPYYCGLIQHEPSGNIHALNLARISLESVLTLFERLSVNKPEFINTVGVFTMAILYLCANCILLILSIRLPASKTDEV